MYRRTSLAKNKIFRERERFSRIIIIFKERQKRGPKYDLWIFFVKFCLSHRRQKCFSLRLPPASFVRSFVRVIAAQSVRNFLSLHLCYAAHWQLERSVYF